jgi:hypothetical protein
LLRIAIKKQKRAYREGMPATGGYQKPVLINASLQVAPIDGTAGP